MSNNQLRTISGLGDLGVVADGIGAELSENAVTDALNFRFNDGYAELISGSQSAFSSASVTPYFLMFYSSDATYWIYCGLTKIYAVTGSTHTNITRQTAGVDVNYAATVENVWTGGVIGGIAIVNNPADDPQYWAGNVASNMAAITAWPANTKCEAMRVFKNYLIALNVTSSGTKYPHLVKWSAAADPGSLPSSWDETDATKDAGQTDLADSQSPIVDGLALGELFIVYKKRSYYSMEYIGAPFIFKFRKIHEGQGALARNCVCETPYGHVVLGQGDVYIHNGGKPESIITGTVRKKLFAEIDSVNYARSFVIANYKKNEVWICYPAIGSSTCNKVLIWNWDRKTVTFRDGQNFTCGAAGEIEIYNEDTWSSDTGTWDSDTTIWDQQDAFTGEQRCLIGSTSNVLHLIDNQTTFNGTTITGYIERTGLDFGQKNYKKLIKGARIYADNSDGEQITVRFGASNSVGAPVSWGSNIPYVIGQSNLACSHVCGRFIAYKITSAVPIKIRTIEFTYLLKSEY